MLTESRLLDFGATCVTVPLHLFAFYLLIHFIEVELIYNAVLISAVQQSGSAIYIMYVYICKIYVYIFFHIPFHSVLSQDIGYSYLCYTVGPCL